MSFTETMRDQLASPIETHPILESVRCWSKDWLPVKIDLLGLTRLVPTHFTHLESTVVVPNTPLVSYVVTGLRMHVEPLSTFYGWRARFVLAQRLIIDEPIAGAALGRMYASFYPTKKMPPLFVKVGSLMNFILEPTPDAASRAAAVKLDILGFEVASSVESDVQTLLKEIPA